MFKEERFSFVNSDGEYKPRIYNDHHGVFLWGSFSRARLYFDKLCSKPSVPKPEPLRYYEGLGRDVTYSCL